MREHVPHVLRAIEGQSDRNDAHIMEQEKHWASNQVSGYEGPSEGKVGNKSGMMRLVSFHVKNSP